jgi:hypothetical protein
MKHVDGRGTPIVNSLRVKVFAVGNKSCTLRLLKPTPGTGWNAAGVEKILAEISADLERRFPAYEYKRVRIGPLAFNFVFVGTRAVPAEGVEDGAPGMGVQNSEPNKS